MYNKAFIVGKFLPPHQGHKMMIDFACSLAREVIVCVEQQKQEPIDVFLRQRWLQQVVPSNAIVQPLLGVHPQSPSDCDSEEAFWAHWKKVIQEHAPKVDVIVSGDTYGAKLAHDLGVAWMPIDRQEFPVSATLIKQNLWEHMEFLIPPAQQAFARRVVVLGSESTGKSSLCRALAEATQTRMVPEYAEHWIKMHPKRAWDRAAFDDFYLGQKALRKATLPLCNGLVFEDSHALTTALYARVHGFDDLAERYLREAEQDEPHHVILASDQGAVWVPDLHRNEFVSLQQDFETILTSWNWPYTVVEGSWEQRTEQALGVVQELQGNWEQMQWEEWLCTTQGLSMNPVASSSKEASFDASSPAPFSLGSKNPSP